MNTQIDISPLKKQLKEEYERLQLEYSELVAKREDMDTYEGPRLEALYMDTIGMLQYDVLKLQYDIALLKTERDMLQSYENRGEEPDTITIKLKVQLVMESFDEQLKREEEKIKEAKEFIKQHMEEEDKQKEADKIEIKQIFKRLVHRLHPDQHPEQTEWERQLFLKVQDAYAAGDLERLRKLEAELDAGMPFTAVEAGTVEEWQERIKKLKDQIAAIRTEIEEMERKFPFNYRDKLYDQEWVAGKKEELGVMKEQLTAEKERLKKIVAILKGEANGQ